MDAGGRLAVIGGFIRAPPAAPHGSWQAAFRLCNAIARTGRFECIDVFHEDIDRLRRQTDLVLPQGVTSRLFERTHLKDSAGAYRAIYVANGDQMYYVPHVLRPDGDVAPVICEIGTAHHAGQWRNLFLAALGGSLRQTDGFIFKARPVEGIYREIWKEWSARRGALPFPATAVIPNGVDLAANTRDDKLRADTRRALGLGPHDVAFLTFSRLSNGTKGDYRALLFSFGRLIERWPHAVLVLSGKAYDRSFLLRLRTEARMAGLANNLIVAEDPYQIWPDARERLMSAADVFVHLSTGAEEAAPQSVLEAMAFGLPVIAAHWAGLPDLVEEGSNGFLVPTYLAEPPLALQQALLAREESLTNIDLGRCVGCDPEVLVRAASILLSNEEARLAMGRQSRRRAELLFSLDDVAGRRVSFFDELSRAARIAGADAPPAPLVDLVQLRSVLWGMGKRPLARADVMAVSREDGFAPARAALAGAGDDAIVELVECVLRADAPITAGELTRRVQGIVSNETETEGKPSQLWSTCSRTLVQFIAYGAVRVAVSDEC